MSTTQEILFGITGQSLVFDGDRPLTSVTSVAVYDAMADDTTTAESATTGSASVDSATEVTTATIDDNTDDRTKLTVASTAGFVVGKRYRIAAGPRAEIVELAGIDTTAALYLRHSLVNNYALGATVNGAIRASIAVDATWVAAVANLSPTWSPAPSYRVRWTVVHADDSTTGVYDRYFDLVRYPATLPVTALDVDRAFPGWLDGLPPDYRPDQGRPLLVEAARVVRARLYKAGVADQAVRDAEAMQALVTAQAVYELIMANALRGATVGAALDVAKDRVEGMFAAFVESPRLSVDLTGAGGATTKEARAQPVTRR